MDREEVVRSRRREEALGSLERERQREEALTERLKLAIRDLEAWRADEEALARMDPEDAELLRRLGFVVRQPPEDSRVRLESQVADLEAQIAEAQRRQHAFESYAEALGGGAAPGGARGGMVGET